MSPQTPFFLFTNSLCIMATLLLLHVNFETLSSFSKIHIEILIKILALIFIINTTIINAFDNDSD